MKIRFYVTCQTCLHLHLIIGDEHKFSKHRKWYFKIITLWKRENYRVAKNLCIRRLTSYQDKQHFKHVSFEKKKTL